MKGPTPEQLRLRELCERLRKEEMPLEQEDLKKLIDFVEVKRVEIKEEGEPGHRRTYKVEYFMLNELGLKLLHKWNMGLLDKHVKD